MRKIALSFCEEVPGIYRLRVPFEAIYTSVFFILQKGERILVDCASSADDVDGHILPALKAMGVAPTDLDKLVLTHQHEDHAGGLLRIGAHSPQIKVVLDEQVLCDGIFTYPMPGPTKDCMGVMDLRSGTLISGDGLQGAGVDRYPCTLQDREGYIETLEKIRNDKRMTKE